MEVFERQPSGYKSIQDLVDWFDDVSKKSSNLKPVWNALKDPVNQSIKHEFSEENPNKWKPLSKKYKNWKVAHGYPTTIGIRKGNLKKALTDSAIIKIKKSSMIWQVNSSMTNEDGEDYSTKFDSTRRIFVNTNEFVQGIAKSALRSYLNKISKM